MRRLVEGEGARLGPAQVTRLEAIARRGLTLWINLLMSAMLVVGAVSGRERRAAASSGEGAREPNGRGPQLLGGREAILLEQSDRARQAARARALTLYRLLRVAELERRSGSTSSVRVGARAVALSTAVLARDLEEARALRGELDRVRAERALVARNTPVGTRPGLDAGQTGAGTRAPLLMRPVGGVLVTPFGVGRDGATGAWLFRAAATFAAKPSELVRSPADARVVRVAGSVAGGTAVVLSLTTSATQSEGWTVVLSGLASVAVAAGEMVGRGEALGTARGAPASTVRVETWRGRSPVDPAAVLRDH